ncbi:MAG: phosphoribosyltransferase family protein [Akkermansia sp.]
MNSAPAHHLCPLFSEEQIDVMLTDMARAIDHQLGDQPYILLGLLNGARPMMDKLCPKLRSSPEVRLIKTSSYEGTTSKGKIKWSGEWGTISQDTPILIVDDVLDTGNTLFAIKEELVKRGASKILTAVAVDKPARRTQKLNADFFGFRIDDHFIVGFGMDFNGAYRELPYIAIVEFDKSAD